MTFKSKHDLGILREQQAAAIKKESLKLLKVKKKQDARDLKQVKEQRKVIKDAYDRVRERSEALAAKKWA